MKRMKCYDYLNHATTCEQLYRFIAHLQRAHGQIPSRIAITRANSQKYQAAALESAYAERR